MILMRLLLLLFAAWIAWRIYRVLTRRVGAQQASPPVVDMVQCARCGLHLPRSGAVQAGADWYCCEAHRDGHDAGA